MRRFLPRRHAQGQSISDAAHPASMRGFGQKAYWTTETMLTMDKGSSLLVPLMCRRRQLPSGSNGLAG